MNTPRQSNMELLRIVAMFSILFWHCIYHGLLPLSDLTYSERIISVTLYRMLYWHVNVFVILSGYFGIRTTALKLFNFVLKVSVYAVLCYTLYAVARGDKWSLAVSLKELLTAFSPGHWWFATVYLILMLLAPGINGLIQSATQKNLLTYLALLGVADMIVGSLFHNNMGHEIVHFLFLYTVGAVMRLENFPMKKISTRYLSLFLPVFLALSYGLSILPFLGCDGYNQLFVVVSSVIIVELFSRIKLNSKLVNSTAAGVFSVYLLHDNAPYTRSLLVNNVRWIHDVADSVTVEFFSMLCLCLGIFAACIIIDIIEPYFIESVVKLGNGLF